MKLAIPVNEHDHSIGTADALVTVVNPDKLSDRHLRHHAKKIGLDLNRFDREMADGVYRERILDSYHNSIVHGITGTPTTFINGELYAMSGVELLSVVRTILKDK